MGGKHKGESVTDIEVVDIEVD